MAEARERWAHELASLREEAHLIELPVGETAFQQGAPIHGVALLFAGRVKLEHLVISGKRLLLGLVEPVAPLDLCALGGRGTHLVSARAVHPAQVGFVPREKYLSWLQARPALLHHHLEEMARILCWLQRRLGQLAYCSVRDQLLVLLYELGARRRPTADGRVQIDLFEQELAEMVGASRETVVRELAALKRQGLVAVRGRTIVVLDFSRLHRQAEDTGLVLGV